MNVETSAQDTTKRSQSSPYFHSDTLSKSADDVEPRRKGRPRPPSNRSSDALGGQNGSGGDDLNSR